MRFSVAAAALLTAGLLLGTAKGITFDVTLDTNQEVPPPTLNGSTPTGLGSVDVNTASGDVSVAGSYSGMTSNVGAAHLHGLADPGQATGVIFGFDVTGGTTGTFTGSGTLSADNLAGLLDGQTYLNVHTANNGPGEIRGQVVSNGEIQLFDSEASASGAGWTEFGSRDNNFDFGFSATSNAQAAPGEGGGQIARSEPLGYYGDVSVGGASDLSVDLHATGRLIFQDSAFDGEFFFGYFNKDDAEANSNSYLGIHVREPRDGIWRVDSSINGADGDRLNIADDTPLNFEIDWDADGGAAASDGKLTLTLTTLDGSESFVSSVEGNAGISVNAFGLLNRPQGGAPDQIGNFWFDDLNYSLVPEPSGILLALCGLVGVASIARRRKI